MSDITVSLQSTLLHDCLAVPQYHITTWLSTSTTSLHDCLAVPHFCWNIQLSYLSDTWQQCCIVSIYWLCHLEVTCVYVTAWSLMNIVDRSIQQQCHIPDTSLTYSAISRTTRQSDLVAVCVGLLKCYNHEAMVKLFIRSVNCSLPVSLWRQCCGEAWKGNPFKRHWYRLKLFCCKDCTVKVFKSKTAFKIYINSPFSNCKLTKTQLCTETVSKLSCIRNRLYRLFWLLIKILLRLLPICRT